MQLYSSSTADVDLMRLELSVKAKNGVNFIAAAIICWCGVAVLWLQPYSASKKALWTFFITTPLLPIAYVLSKVFKTTWSIKHNPLEPLGLWLNFAQLFYFPFVMIAYIKLPETMPIALAIVTGAHFFPYAWFYRSWGYAVMAGVIVIVMMALALILSTEQVHYIPLSMIALLLTLCVWLMRDYYKNRREFEQFSGSDGENSSQ